jgi:aminopeptidase-like protein
VLYRPTENWSFAMTQRFDAQLSTLQEQNYTVYRDFRNWVGALDFSIRNSQGHSEDFTVTFRFTFKAHPRSGPNPIQTMDTY